jgi:predicted phosphodiesterase
MALLERLESIPGHVETGDPVSLPHERSEHVVPDAFVRTGDDDVTVHGAAHRLAATALGDIILLADGGGPTSPA